MNPKFAQDAEAVYSAICRRLANHLDLIKEFGIEACMEVAGEVADDVAYARPIEEIGSSDVSAWIKDLQGRLSNIEVRG